MAFLPPGGHTEIVFSFDTTGSMSAILDEVRGRLQDMIQRLQSDIPGMKIGVFAHGDYCDAEHFYVTKHVDLTDDIKQLCDFVNEVGGTGGGDVEECYELVLRLVQEQMSWQPISQKVLIMIGDAYPHDSDYPENVLRIDWREEVQKLTKMGVRVYGVQVGSDDTSEEFFKTLSEEGGGQYLKLSNFSNICDFIMAICYRERGDEFLHGYEAEVRARAGRSAIGKDLEGLFGTLKRGDSKASTSSQAMASLMALPNPVSPLPVTVNATVTATETPTPAIKAASKVKVARPNGRKPKPRVVAARKQSKKTSSTRKIGKNKTSRKRLLREKVTQTNFAYNNIRWSPWKLAIVPPGDTEHAGKWRNVPKCEGIRKECLFRGKNTKNTFYEVSVQVKPHTKRHVVMCKVLNGNSAPNMWFRSLFSQRTVKAQLQNILKHGFRLFVRKAELTSRKQTTKQAAMEISDTYDYAWELERKTRACHRNVYVRHEDMQVTISDLTL